MNPVIWVVAAALTNGIVALAPRFFPYGDTENHLARYVLIARAWRHAGPPWVHFHWVPTAYIAVDSAGAALASFISPEATLRVLVAAYVIALPAAFYLLFRAVDRNGRSWAVAACLLTFNWYFLTGFLSYVIGIAAAFLWLAWWWPRRSSTTPLELVCGGLSAGILYMIHMSSAITVATVLGAWCIEPLVQSRQFAIDHLRAVGRRCLVASAYLAPAILIHVTLSAANVLPPPTSDALVFRDAADKFRHFFTPFASFSKLEAGFLASVYAIALTVRFAKRKTNTINTVWATAVVVMLIAYVLFPLVALGAWDVDVRFLLPAYLLAFLALPGDARDGRAWAQPEVWLFAATVLHAAIVGKYSRTIDTRISDFLALGTLAPPHAHILALSSSEDDFFRIDPFTHAAERLVADDPTIRVNGLFAGGPNGAYLGHFIVSKPPYDPGIHWARKGFPVFDWNAVRRDYSTILLEGNGRLAMRRILEGATRVAVRGDAAIFAVRRP